MNTQNIGKKVLLMEGVHIDSVKILENNGFEVERIMTSLPPAELKEKIKNVNFIGIRSRTNLTKEILNSAKNLTGIFCFCIGTNQVDLDHAQKLGIPVFNSPFSNTRSVAELVLGIMIFLMRGIPQKNLAAHRGDWQKSAKNSFEVRKKKLGIIGYGNIGTQLSVIASGLGIHVYYYDIANKLPHGNSRKVDSLKELLEISDVVSLHVPATPETENMMNRETFAQMKDGSYLINYSRGNVVDIDALVENLESGKILGAAIDVFPVEPKSKEEEFISPLRKFENVILTPHIGGSTKEAQENIGTDAADKLVKFAKFGITAGAVNFPELNIPLLDGKKRRIIHMHGNVPGVMRKIHEIVFSREINISGEWLQTSGEIGYAVLDLDKIDDEKSLLTELEKIDGTIRTKIL